MAAPIDCAIIRVESNASTTGRSTSSSRLKSFDSLGSTRPRDSLEKMRRMRNKSLAQTPSPLAHNRIPATARSLSVQDIPEDYLEGEETVESEVESALLLLPSPNHSPVSHNTICERYPKGKASFLILLLNFIVSYAFGAAITGILDIFQTENDENLTSQYIHLFYFLNLLFQFCISRLFYPIAGFIADVYTGRGRMITISFVCLGIGYVLLIISFVLESQHNIPTNTLNIIRGISFLIISAGGGGFEATIIPFGVDQLQGASSAEISSYFYFFYFTRNLGTVCGTTIYSVVLYITKNEYNSYSMFNPLATTVILVFGITLYICLNHWLFRNTLWENPVKLVAKVLCYAATAKRHLPVRRRAFRYGEGKKSRIDLAKVQYDGKYPAEKVEDVKTFCRILLLMFTLFPNIVSVLLFNTMIPYEINVAMKYYFHGRTLENDVYPNIFTGINVIVVLLTLPVINFIVIPCAPKLTIRSRIAIGLILYLIGNVTTVIIHSAALVHKPQGYITVPQLGCLLAPVAIFAVAEVFTVVSALEFIYAQSPESMKGLLTGLFFFILGLSSVASSTFFYLYSSSLQNRRLVPYHTAATVIQVVGLVFYGVVASLHKNRLRPDGDSFSRQEQLIIENQIPCI